LPLRNSLAISSPLKLGFTETDAQVYTFPATEGQQEARDIAEAVKLHKLQLYRISKKMGSI
jgi:sugar-specific transcriptional regulator TrmB